MKRVLYSIPLFFLLLPWLFISVVIIGVGIVNPFALLLLFPTGALLGGAVWIHRNRSKHGQHGLAALGAATVLAAPLVAIVVAFFSCGQDLAYEQAERMGALDQFDTAPATSPVTNHRF